MRLFQCALVAFAVAFAASQAQASIIIEGTIEGIPNTQSNNGGTATTVDYWHFTVNSAGQIDIDVLSWEWDKDSDGTAHFMDPYIYLFNDDGSLDAGDYITANDDSGATFGDGSTNGLDSFLSVNLAPGNYVLAISDFFLDVNDAVSGVNFNGYYPAADDGNGIQYEYEGGNTLDTSYADYRITFTGDVTVQDQPLFPNPQAS